MSRLVVKHEHPIVQILRAYIKRHIGNIWGYMHLLMTLVAVYELVPMVAMSTVHDMVSSFGDDPVANASMLVVGVVAVLGALIFLGIEKLVISRRRL